MKVTRLEYVAPDQLLAHPLNPKIHPQTQHDALQGVIEEVGYLVPILVNERTQHVLDGHERISRALYAGQPRLPVVYVDIDEAQERTALATIDAVARLAGYDTELLTLLLQDVHSDNAAVQALVAQLAEQEGVVPPDFGQTAPLVDPEPEMDRAEELRAQWGVELGQMWQLGPHRVLCGDCREPENIARVLQGEMPTLVIADPPYGVSIVATNVPVGGGEAYDIPFGGVKHRRRSPVGGGQRQKDVTGHYPIESWGKARGSDGAAKPFGSKKVRGTVGASHVVAVGKYASVIGDESPATAILAVTALLAAYPAAVHVWWGGNYYADHLPASACWLVWDKDTTGNFADCELAWTNQDKAARLFHHRWNGMVRESERERRWHPTQKPAALAAWVFDILGRPGDVVLDPFLGCGPSVIAAEQTGRTCCGIELSPEYVAVTLQRWADLTGQTPQRREE